MADGFDSLGGDRSPAALGKSRWKFPWAFNISHVLSRGFSKFKPTKGVSQIHVNKPPLGITWEWFQSQLFLVKFRDKYLWFPLQVTRLYPQNIHPDVPSKYFTQEYHQHSLPSVQVT